MMKRRQTGDEHAQAAGDLVGAREHVLSAAPDDVEDGHRADGLQAGHQPQSLLCVQRLQRLQRHRYAREARAARTSLLVLSLF